MENNELKKCCFKHRTCYNFDVIIKNEDFDFDSILLDEKLHKNVLIYNISCKTLIVAKPLRIRFDKVFHLLYHPLVLLEFMIELDI